jgi:hypothetical protein
MARSQPPITAQNDYSLGSIRNAALNSVRPKPLSPPKPVVPITEHRALRRYLEVTHTPADFVALMDEAVIHDEHRIGAQAFDVAANLKERQGLSDRWGQSAKTMIPLRGAGAGASSGSRGEAEGGRAPLEVKALQGWLGQGWGCGAATIAPRLREIPAVGADRGGRVRLRCGH